ncbi:hypothetical protein QAD02_005598 [Eretmocerus hayati]|uniref:Uncharacterized protein n=1 Tax=Eretmocerus hayati TaxID=131215 RepID=A0ACC2NUN9_9HYME|nr:hypothetical protein QAD02_005598 [Eretmocerus hayati]
MISIDLDLLQGGVEHEDEVYSVRQLEARENLLKREYEEARWCIDPAVPLAEFAPPDRKPLVEKPVSVTASLFRFQEKPRPQAVIKGRPRINLDSKENGTDKLKERVPPQCQIGDIKSQQQFLAPDFSVEPLAPELYQSSIGSVPPPPALLAPREAPQTATASIFAPRTKDMNKGFLTFSEDQPGLTMLKDEPEDLTHLAPTAGDVCVPLEEPPFLSDMLDEFINSNYCPLLSPELPPEPIDQLADQPSANSRVSVVLIESPGGPTMDVTGPKEDSHSTDQQQTILSDSLTTDDCCNSSDTCGDPFIYRDSPSRCSLGTDLHSPAITKSPEGSGIGDSLNSPNGSGLSEDEMLMLSISDVMADDELALRAPYIPMSDQDEALQLLISDDMVMWGPSQTSDKKSKWLSDTVEDNANSSLAQLLTNEPRSKKMKGIGGDTLVNPAQVLGQVTLKNAPRDPAITEMRSNKRVHAPYNSISNNGRGINGNESKRVKHCNSSELDPGGVGPPSNSFQSSLESLLSGSVQSSQLLQQLVSQQQHQGINCKPRNNWNDSTGTVYNNSNRPEDDGGGGSLIRNRSLLAEDIGDGKQMFQNQQRQHQQQSNSVLMNLLVSGCDYIQTDSIQFRKSFEDSIGKLHRSETSDENHPSAEAQARQGSPLISNNNSSTLMSICTVNSDVLFFNTICLYGRYQRPDGESNATWSGIESSFGTASAAAEKTGSAVSTDAD